MYRWISHYLPLTDRRNDGSVITRAVTLHAHRGLHLWKDLFMRTLVTLACSDCKRRNYTTYKNKSTHPERMELKKYCRWCGHHTVHKETR